MQTTWSVDRVLALAPDPSSAKSGRELGEPRKWARLGRSEQALWGECQGSGSSPYQTQIDLSQPAFKCSCPSRKFPCKHGLGLFLIFAKNGAAIPAGEPPEWVAKWLSSRQERAKPQAAPAPVDTAAQAKRQASREAKVSAGMAELRLLLLDLFRQGLSDLPSRP